MNKPLVFNPRPVLSLVRFPSYQSVVDSLTGSGRSQVTCTFSELEERLGRGLPVLAYLSRDWWANDGVQEQSRAWVGAGWQVDVVYLAARVVTFVKRSGRESRTSPVK